MMSSKQCAIMQSSGVLRTDSPIGCGRLRKITFKHIDFTGQTRHGEIVVLDAVAPNVQLIFDALYARRFPLAKALPIEHYRGDDQASMADNNTSAFNARPITGGTDWSLHAYGAAIDLNPWQNPYLSFDNQTGTLRIQPTAAAKTYVNRLNIRPDKALRVGLAEEVVDLFAENGFIRWGGYWDSPIDYQHFELGSRQLIKQLAKADQAEARWLFLNHVSSYTRCMAQPTQASHSAKRAACVTANQVP